MNVLVKGNLDGSSYFHFFIQKTLVIKEYFKDNNMDITLCMIVKNEGDFIEKCLTSIKTYVKEIVIVDTGSTDNTIEISKSFGARVFHFDWKDDFAAARNFALSKSTSDWNLILDADEQVINWDFYKINQQLDSGKFIGKVNINNIFIQNNEERYSHTCISRLLPKGTYFSGKIHEQVVSDLPRFELPIEIMHTGYYKTDKSSRNLPILETELSENPSDPYILFQLARQYKTLNRLNEAAEYFKDSYKFATGREEYFSDLVVNYIYTLIDLKQFYPAFEVIDQMDGYLANSPDYQFVRGLFFMNFVLSDTSRNIDFLPLIERSYLASLELGKKGEGEIVLGTASFLAAYNLGVYYEMFNQKDKAKYFYEFSASYNYEPAKKRLKF
jgi:glycosyltransferase involved in cell wall biosynthesis